jgi:hypothetical protein
MVSIKSVEIILLIFILKIMSTPFVLGQRIISFNEFGALIESKPSSEIDLSYQVVSDLHTSVSSQNAKQFKHIYETQYISNQTIKNYFHFGDQGPYDEYNSYSLCSCPNKNDEPEYINKFLSVRPCCCVNGKRYLAYLCAFNGGKTNYYHTQHIQLSSSDVVTEIKEYLLKDGPIDLNYVDTVREPNF